MTLERPIPMQATDTDTPFPFTAQQIRAGLAGSIFSREGVVGPEFGALRLSQRGAGPSLSFDVSAGRCAVQGDDASDQGMYVCNSTAVENRATPQPPGSGTRRHRVIARVRDRVHNTGWAAGTYDWVIEILSDTGAGPPSEPDTAITLGFVRMRANQVSILDSDIDRTPVLHTTRATVGTPDRIGSWTALSPDYSAEDVTRPLRWAINSEGYVSLAGFLRFKKPNAPLTAMTEYRLTQNVLPPEIRPTVAAYRDMVGACSMGVCHYVLKPDGHLYYRVLGNLTIVQNQSWWSLDNVGWKV